MTTSPAGTRQAGRTGLGLRIVGALALGFSAYLHFRIAAERPPLFADGQVTLSGLFVAQAVAATIVSLWVLVRGRRLAWIAFTLVALGSLAALVASVYIQIPSIGPFPVIYEPLWYTDKYLAAGAAAVASIIGIIAIARTGRPA